MPVNITTPFTTGQNYADVERAKYIAVAEFFLGAGATAGVSTWAQYYALVNPIMTALGLTTIADGITGQQETDRMNALNDVLSAADMASLYARITATPTDTRAKQYAKLEYDIKKVTGLWALLDGLAVIGADSQASRRNLKADEFNLTAVGAPTFVADRYWEGDAVAAYLQTNHTPTSVVRSLALDSAHIGVWSLSNITDGVKYDAGNGNLKLNADNGGGLRGTVNDVTTINFGAPAPSLGHFLLNRRDSAGRSGYRNGALLQTVAQASTAVSANNIIFMGQNGTNFSNRRLCVEHWGGGLSDVQVTGLYNALSTYLTAIGAI